MNTANTHSLDDMGYCLQSAAGYDNFNKTFKTPSHLSCLSTAYLYPSSNLFYFSTVGFESRTSGTYSYEPMVLTAQYDNFNRELLE